MTSVIDIQINAFSTEVPDKKQIREWVRAVFSLLNRRLVPLTVRIVDEKEIRDLNRLYRGNDQVTNVLSFAYEPLPNVDVDLLGDVVICGSVVVKEAKDQEKLFMDHWALIVVHGILHLFGYDHETEDQAAIMEHLEIKLLNGLGFAIPHYQEIGNFDKEHA
ncbi:MAG: rRNA maturation RNase YbeY [Acidiferrobacteraceae bacterium]|nr:rRNA maturation RNase YbeY [Acidiferrobacteraceae bacterium]